MKTYYVYILSNWTGSVLYIGVTNDLIRRLFEHRQKEASTFTAKYNVEKLVYFEQCPEADIAIAREKQLKNWRRDKKIRLIEGLNPDWHDLSEGWYEGPSATLRSGRDDSFRNGVVK